MALCESRHQSLSVCRARLSICQGTLFTENSALWISLGGDHRRSGSGAISQFLWGLPWLPCVICVGAGAGLLVSSLSFAASRGEQKSAFLQVSFRCCGHSLVSWTWSILNCCSCSDKTMEKGWTWMDMDGPWNMLQALIVLPFVLAVVDFSELLVTHLEGSSEWVCLKMGYTVIYSYTVIPPKRPY